MDDGIENGSPDLNHNVNAMGSHGYKLMHLEHLMLATCRGKGAPNVERRHPSPSFRQGEVRLRPRCRRHPSKTTDRQEVARALIVTTRREAPLLSVASSNRLAKAKFSVKGTVVM